MISFWVRTRDPVLTLCLPRACRQAMLEAQCQGRTTSVFVHEGEVTVTIARPGGAPPAFISCPAPPQ